MTRFWITLTQGVDFVLSSLGMMRGGEVFVPRIPSMKVIDLARVIAPTLPVKEFGIRPGEKVHEIMITEDDARNTVRLGNRYIIEPVIGNWWSPDYYRSLGASPVGETFRYASDINDDWLDDEGMLKLLEESET
jgi:UDP-N-acetylglucosamine 4,6-dehydratase